MLFRSGESSPGAGHASSDVGEDEVMESGVVQLIGGDGEAARVTQTGGEESTQFEEAPQSTLAGAADQVEGPAFAVTLSVHPTTGATTYTFLLRLSVDPNYPLGYDSVINVPQFARPADTAVGSSTSAIPPIGPTSTASFSSSAIPPNGSGATAALPGGILTMTTVLQTTRSMLENLESADATLIVPYATTTTTTAAVASAGHEAAVADDVAPSSGSRTEPDSSHHGDDGGNGGSPSDLDSSSSGSSAGQDGGEGREKRRRVGDLDEDSLVV